MIRKAKLRAKNIGDDVIGAVVSILDGWSERLTWELLIDAIEKHISVRYTRQALFQHEQIKHAFQLTKERLGGLPKEKTLRTELNAVEAQALLERVGRLEAEILRLKDENKRLLEQFVVWAYNAHTRGLDNDFLSRPLPRVNRDQTKLKRT